MFRPDLENHSALRQHLTPPVSDVTREIHNNIHENARSDEGDKNNFENSKSETEASGQWDQQSMNRRATKGGTDNDVVIHDVGSLQHALEVGAANSNPLPNLFED